MDRKIEESIERTYESIQRDIPRNLLIDSLEVVKQVIQYRQFWKPENTNVVLLAESHVYTDEKDYEIECNRSVLHRVVPNYPIRFARFVYCLGYGEDRLLSRRRTDRRNSGTPQFWKIFSSCVAENENDLGFHKILKTRTHSFISRLHNKVNVLRKLKEKGVWLLDASIVGLYGSDRKDSVVIERIMQICWRNHIADVILEAHPKHIIVIGKGVENILRSRLRRLKIPFTVIAQPQARGTSQWQLENYRTYQRVCARYCNGKYDKRYDVIKDFHEVTKQPEAPVIIKTSDTLRPLRQRKSGGIIEQKLTALGYRRKSRSNWVKAKRVVQLSRSSRFGMHIRIIWKEEWKDSHAIVYDYSDAGGPVCIVPVPVLFASNFVKRKRQSIAYANSGYWWSQIFPTNHELSKIVLKFKDRWDIL